ncbi:regulatory signaling modulator protein AmpE [Marinicellulosiphila megalodicopiae]|uniref:regulatory signaling modulator protein AmpE n=1 Tax=Marinicellulosiphila megalodicopiae TaxID=2724896 RepID=UPI003BB06049
MILVILAIAFAVFRFSHFNPQRIILPIAQPVLLKIHSMKQANGLVALFIGVILPTLISIGILTLFPQDIFIYSASLVLLIVAFAGNNYQKHLEDFIALRKNGNDKQAFDVATHHLGLDPEKHNQNDPNLYDAVNRGIIGLQFNSLFLCFFWYVVLLGHPSAVVLILCLNLFIKTAPCAPLIALNLRHALAWIPVRLTGLTFALVGDFVRCINVWFKDLLDIQMPSRKILQEYANAALGEMIEPDELSLQIIKLLQRSLIVWIVLIALISLFGDLF